MSNWYTTREKLKRAISASSSPAGAALRDALIDQHIAAASRTIDKRMGKPAGAFLPKIETHYFPWPQRKDIRQELWLDADLISVTTLMTKNNTVEITSSYYLLEPANTGPPYRRIEIDWGDDVPLNQELIADDTPQRAISVLGSWGYSDDTEAAGALAAAIASTTATTLNCSDASLIDVGDTILIDDEQMFVSGRGTLDTACNTDGALTAEMNDLIVAVDDGTKVKAGEVILINAERFYVESVSGDNVAVQRGHDETTLAEHDDGQDVYAFRTLTVVRGVNGTTAATHSNAADISVYAPPADIQTLCQAEAIFNYEQDKSGHTGVVGGVEGGVPSNPNRLRFLWEKAIADYGEMVCA